MTKERELVPEEPQTVEISEKARKRDLAMMFVDIAQQLRRLGVEDLGERWSAQKFEVGICPGLLLGLCFTRTT